MLHVDQCPNTDVALARLDDVLKRIGRDDVRVLTQLVDSEQQAEECGLRGSPTILVDGIDVSSPPGTPIMFACRAGRPEDIVPSVDELLRALGG
ncbi:MAG: thioredoxin family protein [Nitriliruptorales bacterium]